MWDLTHVIHEEMVLYPGTPAPVLQSLADVATDGYAMSEYRFWNHLGTHVDAPSHFVATGRSLDEYPLERLICESVVLDCQGRPTLEPDWLRENLGDCPPPGLFLVTGQYRHWGTPRYYDAFPVLSSAGARWLGTHGVQMLAVDAPSVDPVTTTEFPVHRILLAQDLLLVENVAYTEELPARIQLWALPLKVQRANGSPARVVATAWLSGT